MSAFTVEQNKIIEVITSLISQDGGSLRIEECFYTPKQWRARGEDYGRNSVLVLVHDGGDLAPYCNFDYECYSLMEKMSQALKSIGYYCEQCTSWYSAIYKN